MFCLPNKVPSGSASIFPEGEFSGCCWGHPSGSPPLNANTTQFPYLMSDRGPLEYSALYELYLSQECCSQYLPEDFVKFKKGSFETTKVKVPEPPVGY